MLHIQRYSFDEAIMDKRNLLTIVGAIVVAGVWVAGGRSASEAGLRDAVRTARDKHPRRSRL